MSIYILTVRYVNEEYMYDSVMPPQVFKRRSSMVKTLNKIILDELKDYIENENEMSQIQREYLNSSSIVCEELFQKYLQVENRDEYRIEYDIMEINVNELD